MTMHRHCVTCKAVTSHWHLHDLADGIPETHVTGSEHFRCRPCGRLTFAHQPGAEAFPFVLDGQVNRKIAA
ncbi:MAG: hypothetical protein Q8L13_11555 [Bradyrhizobium sp.]|uniref:hypothetical protein n=1 Tax=Bradyrhizobium sp. TaxID=376 RepID=UPI00272EF201|nr:hypothetical protein [Bradyrhizobium sp.]MDP1866960.1 hypothetical protein [Bradyrhizobium sp.]